MRCSSTCRPMPPLQPPPRKQDANQRPSSPPIPLEKGRQAHQPRRRTRPGTSTAPRPCRQPRARRTMQPRPRLVVSDHRPSARRSTLRDTLPRTLMAALFFIACAISRMSLPHWLSPNAIRELAARPRHRRRPRRPPTRMGTGNRLGGAGDTGASRRSPHRAVEADPVAAERPASRRVLGDLRTGHR